MNNELKWTIDQSHSEISFKIRHLMISHVKGTFKIFDASIYTTEKKFATAEIDLWIDAASISTGDEKRDEHLRSADFFDVANHKQITFVSNSIQKSDSRGNHELWGNLTIRGVTKHIKLNVYFGGIIKDPWGNEKAGFTVTGKINRTDWGLVWNTLLEAGSVLVSEELDITCDVELVNSGKKNMVMDLDSMPLAINNL